MNEYGFLRVASVSPQVYVGQVERNTQEICAAIDVLKQEGVQVAVFPELCITGYTCADLFQQTLLLDKAEEALQIIASHCVGIAVFVGLPLRGITGALYNCAVLLCGDKKLVFPKKFIPNYSEFYEKRWFTPYQNEPCLFADYEIGELLYLSIDGCKSSTKAIIGCEICEDVWVPNSPSTKYALNGANVIVNLSAGNEVIGKADYRKQLIAMNSAKNICAYVYANAGMGESTQDMVFSGHSMIAENGTIVSEKIPFDNSTKWIIADVDIEKLNHERMHCETFSQPDELKQSLRFDEITVAANQKDINRVVPGFPFVPSEGAARSKRAEEITRMQAWGLAKRIAHTHIENIVVGISGGLDSTLALLVACQAFDILGKDRKGIHGITMPGFGTTGRTYENAKHLVEYCGATLCEISIKESATLHLQDLNHSLDIHDITYENAQARERTQILFDYANMHNALVLGTGDLSELALGWCTYNGDQMSNYAVNVSIPKTLVRYLVQYYADYTFVANKPLVEVLLDVIDTPVSPELLPPDKDGKIAQKTENSIGSYTLHDFFLFHTMRNGFSPKKIYYLVRLAIAQKQMPFFEDAVIKDTMKMFYRRFFAQQFKRSCMPDGVKVGSISFSPRGDWRMPSDACADIWLAEVESL